MATAIHKTYKRFLLDSYIFQFQNTAVRFYQIFYIGLYEISGSHDIPVKLLVSEYCPDTERPGIFSDGRIEWVKIKSSIDGNQIELYDYSNPESKLHKTFYSEAKFFAGEFEKALSDVDVCIMHGSLLW